MKKYIVKKLKQWLLELESESESESKSYGIVDAPVSNYFRNKAEFSNPINIVLYNLEGGLVVKFYHEVKGRYEETAYVVKDTDELQTKLGQMISAELLKK